MAACLLVLTDFSAAADKALAYADALAVPLGASLVLLHIRREGLLDPDAFTGRIRHMSEGEVAAALAAQSATLASPVSVEAAVGSVTEAMQQAVEQYQPLLVVLGKPATDTTPDELVASTSLTLLRATAVPLLVVPVASNAAMPAAHVLLAADGQPFQLKPAVTEAARHLLTSLAATLTVSYVAEPEDSDDCSASLATVHASGLASTLANVSTHGTRHRRPAQGILHAAAEKQADLLLLIARRRSFFGLLFNRSVTAQVVLHSNLPVLLLPAIE